VSEYTVIYAVDFDGTLCESKYPGIGAPNTKLIEHLIKKRSHGAKIILWTCRVDERLQEAVDWCKEHGLEFDAVNDNLPEMIEKYGNNTRKIHATCYIDDLAVDKEKYGIPFKANEISSEIKELVEKYPIGSLWEFRTDMFTIPVRITEHRGKPHGIDMNVKNVSSIPPLQHYQCCREIEWFEDKLFNIDERILEKIVNPIERKINLD
jgi:hypothetical protein